MLFTNETNLEAGWTLGFERDGRELIIVVVKATYNIPLNNEPCQLAEYQIPLVEADQFTGEPGLTAPLYETDYSPKKQFCDVLFNGCAYSPDSQPVKRVRVGFSVGGLFKTFEVTGNRYWHKVFLGVDATEPEPFVKQPFSYNNAYGGVDDSDPKHIETYVTNPVGCGFLPRQRNFDYLPMPCTEELGQPIKNLNGKYRPMALGSIGRSWTPRYKYAGTYDDHWLSTKAPFYPSDFDYRFYQAAPSDQQIPYPSGGEQVELINLSENHHNLFHLPKKNMPVLMIPKRGKETQIDGALDTIVIEPDRGIFTLTWRVSYPLRRNMFEMAEIIVDETTQEHEEFKEYSKNCGGC